MDFMDMFFGVVLVLVLAAAAVYLLRKVATWYWRVNEAIELLKSIDQSLKRLR